MSVIVTGLDNFEFTVEINKSKFHQRKHIWLRQTSNLFFSFLNVLTISKARIGYAGYSNYPDEHDFINDEYAM